MDDTHRLNLSAGLASVAVALFLVAIKLWALATTGALSVAASLTDSALDLVASSAGLIGILYAARPPDEDHSFGHSSVEDLVALGQALLVVASAAAIGWSGARPARRAAPLAAEEDGLAVMAVSVAVTLGAGALAGAGGAAHRLADRGRGPAALSLRPAAGARRDGGARRRPRFGVLWLDPVIALVACAVLVIGARRIGLAAWDALMDREADPELVAGSGASSRPTPAFAASTTCAPAPPAPASSSRSTSSSTATSRCAPPMPPPPRSATRCWRRCRTPTSSSTRTRSRPPAPVPAGPDRTGS